MKYKLLIITALLLAAPLALASHSHDDRPLWAKSADYATPTNTQTQIWHDDTRPTRSGQHTKYVYHDIHHPPRVWYVHRNENFYRTNAGTSSYHRSTYKSSYSSGYATTRSVYHGDGFSRYY